MCNAVVCVLGRGHHGVFLRVSDRGQWFLGVSFRPHHCGESAGASHVFKLRRSSESGHRSSERPLSQHPHLRTQGKGAEQHHQDMELMDLLRVCMRGGEGHREITDSKKTVAGFFTMALQKSLWLKRI